jgi:A/G-specific adenine glycosylase
VKALVDWYHRGHRDLPWRRTQDPYRIWVSEIMLQQTRAQAVIPYYQRFLDRFPTVEALAAAAEQDVLALWAGLGYYSRARNLRRAAQQVVEAGGFPREYTAIRELPGIGDYTAAAVASIAFELPHAVVDGNVLRVVARMENDAADIATPRTRERFRTIVRKWMGRLQPGVFNQALMELGATVCLPANPLCRECPIARRCRALAAGTVGQLPVKLRKTTPVAIAAVLLLVRRGERVLLRQREAGARRMAGFWELPALEELPPETLQGARAGKSWGEFRHTITHHHYTFTVRSATVRAESVRATGADFRWFPASELTEIPLSTAARKALKLVGFL